MIASALVLLLAAPPAEGLARLDPLVGTWTAEVRPMLPNGEPSDLKLTIEARYAKLFDGRFLTYDLKAVDADGKTFLEHHVVLAPEGGQFKATGFRGDGYRWEAYWEQGQAEGDLPGPITGRFVGKDLEGNEFSGTATKTFTDADTFTESVTMSRDGEAVPEIPAITFKRKK